MAAAAQEDAANPTRPDSAAQRRERRMVLKRRDKRRFRFALAAALLFHLSMITVFEIVIPFPRHDMEYYNVAIVSSPVPATAPDPAHSGDLLALSGTNRFDERVPAVALPVIEFAELERLRIRYDASEPLPDLEGFFGPDKPADSWARFGGELHRLGKSLRALALPGESGTAPAISPETRRVLPHRPAEGFEAYIEWNTAPQDRELLFAPPVKALWRVNPADLQRSLEIVFKVDPSGRVVNVWSPMIDDDGLIDDVQLTVLQYRFAPLAGYTATTPREQTAAPLTEQSGVLIIRAARSAP